MITHMLKALFSFSQLNHYVTYLNYNTVRGFLHNIFKRPVIYLFIARQVVGMYAEFS